MRSSKEFDNTTISIPARPSAMANSADERHLAVRAVCSMAATAGEAAEVLAMLGLDPREGRQP